MLIVCCYRHLEKWKSRERAKDFYLRCMMGTEGAESERYQRIWCALDDGAVECWDYHDDYLDAIANERWCKFPNGTSIRDFNGKIEYPL